MFEHSPLSRPTSLRPCFPSFLVFSRVSEELVERIEADQRPGITAATAGNKFRVFRLASRQVYYIYVSLMSALFRDVLMVVYVST